MKSDDWTSKVRNAVSVLAREDGFLVSSSGNIKWTQPGLDKMRPRFAAAGIDIHQLRDLEQYVRARMAIAPLFAEALVKVARGQGPITNERSLLMAIVEGDDVRARQSELRLENRKSPKS
jgi:hypothetical protein